jgi:hypothetical protein
MALTHVQIQGKPSKQQLLERLVHELEGQNWTTIRVAVQTVLELLYEKEHQQLAFPPLSYDFIHTDYHDEGRALVVTMLARKTKREPNPTAGKQH